MATEKRKHPYLAGNYAPIHTTLESHPCQFEGEIPEEFLGGQYVRNGSNALQNNNQQDQPWHWFDGDGMLTGVFFKRTHDSTRVKPMFSNQYILTDVHCAVLKNPYIYPVLPSVATLVSTTSSLLRILLGVFRSMGLILSSILGVIASPVRRVSSANTNILYHDGRVLATCEIGPPIRVSLPSLRTVGWFTGCRAEGDSSANESEQYFGGPGVEGFYKEMTTAHPRVDPQTGELLLFHSTFLPPFVHYSIIPAKASKRSVSLNKPVPGLTSGKLMHDFGVSRNHTIILDLPLSLDPFNLLHNKPTVEYNPKDPTRLGVFPRYHTEDIKWYETDASIVMHTVNTWDENRPDGTYVHMLLCRMNSVAPLYHMGNLDAPAGSIPEEDEPECRLYYYQFPPGKSGKQITEQWALSAIPFEFPHVPRKKEMESTRFVYGCSMRDGNFASSVVSSVKIDCLVKVDVEYLLAKAELDPPEQVTGCVDSRSIKDILSSGNENDCIQVFALPEGWYAQECAFIPRKDGKSEDDGWLITYVFDEAQLNENGDAPEGSYSELWIIDARGMNDVVGRVRFPQRVPYGMHGGWFSEEEILNQRGVKEFRSLE